MTTGGKQVRIVPTTAEGWCDPDTGQCHIDARDEATTVGTEEPDGSRAAE